MNHGARTFLAERITAQREAHTARRLRWVAVQVFIGDQNNGGPLREERAAEAHGGEPIQTRN
jgi:hypothetical protein